MNLVLQPSFIRSSVKISTLCALACVAGYFLQGCFEHHWWSSGYAISLTLPICLMVIFVWFAFVPTYLEVSDTHFTIQFPFRSRQTLSWEELKCYFKGNGVFVLNFDDGQKFQISPSAYSKMDWKCFMDFLENQYPELKATGWIGASGYGSRRDE